jgi:hypothetical protein
VTAGHVARVAGAGISVRVGGVLGVIAVMAEMFWSASPAVTPARNPTSRVIRATTAPISRIGLERI